ncbi:MAG: alpha-E domain-containing protein [Pseudomonadota bacterium]
MLSRVAEGLFWMSRYVERMENIARLLDLGRRMDALPTRENAPLSEWTSVVIASGCSESFPHDLKTEANMATVADHLIRDEGNPSSIAACIHATRANAKAMRIALSSEVWEAVNQTSSELRQQLQMNRDQENLTAFLDWVRGRAAIIRGTISGTLLRDQGYGFIELGKWFERADATARLLDVKYHVLLPSVTDVGGGLDYLQWTQILRAANSTRSFRHIYRRSVDPEGVIDLLVLNSKSPRSLLMAIRNIYHELSMIALPEDPKQQVVLAKIRGRYTQLMDLTVDEIFSIGLHEWLTDFIVSTNLYASETADVFGFGAPATQSQDQNSQ